MLYHDEFNSPDANQVFRIINCYQNVLKYGSPDQTLSYCITQSVELFGYLILIALASFVMTIQILLHRRAYGKKCDCREFWRKDRHKLFILVECMLLALIIKEMFLIGYLTWTMLLIA